MNTPQTISYSELIRAAREKKYQENRWSHRENLFSRRSKWRDPYLAEHEVSFTIAMLVLFRRSLFGTFLRNFNEQQEQDKRWNNEKLEILNWDLKSLTPAETKHIEDKNFGIENAYSLLTEAVEKCEVIDWDYLHERLQSLRISNLYITVLDRTPRKFRNLQVLVLCANWLKDVPGKNLPRKLKFLELYGNKIENLENLVRKAPKGLLFIGLGRNNLTDSSQIHLLANRTLFEELRCVDLSDNDIYDVLAIVTSFTSLKHLTCLQLEGNPCSVCESYKDIILKYLPNLFFLDNTQVIEQDKQISGDAESGLRTGALVFTCHRIIGLPPPPKEKGLLQTIHVEIYLPLLEEITIEPEVIEEPKEEEETGKKGNKKGKKDKKGKNAKGKPKKSKNTISLKKSKTSSKSSKKASPYLAPDEYADEVKKKIKDRSFKTERAPWSKVIQFPEDAIVVEHPNNDLKAIRDTFRSSVNVRIVYLKIEPPAKKKKGKEKKSRKEKQKKDKKGKKKDKKDKKNARKTGSETSTDALKMPEEVKEPTETILKKVTLANFYCDLYDVNWSDKTIDFYWADHPKANPKAIPVVGSLRSIYYAGDKGTPTTPPPSGDSSRKKVPLPNMFTCQVGFGLRRI